MKKNTSTFGTIANDTLDLTVNVLGFLYGKTLKALGFLSTKLYKYTGIETKLERKAWNAHANNIQKQLDTAHKNHRWKDQL